MATCINGTFHNLRLEASNDSFLCGPAPAMAQPQTTISSVGLRVLHKNSKQTKKVQHRRRKITPLAGRAIEILGHAIEYLADEHALDCISRPERSGAGSRTFMHPRVTAIELLKAKNREIYFSCPEVETLGERLRTWLRLQRA